MNRTVILDRQVGGGWRLVASDPPTYEAKPLEPVGRGTERAQANETLEFRLRVDNGYPWSYSERYRVFSNGLEVASGTLEAGARSEGEAAFTVRAEGAHAGEQTKDPSGAAVPVFTSMSIEVLVGNSHLFAYVEVSS